MTALLASLPVELVTPKDAGIAFEVDETGSSYLENARLKALAGVRLTRLASLGEDAGLEIDALGGEPGLRSARYAGPKSSGAENLDRVVTAVGERGGEGSPARFRCVAVLALPDGREFSGDGLLEGRVSAKREGRHGFGYDPIFILPDGRHLAELPIEEKNLLSHRARALAALEVHGAFDALLRLPAGGGPRSGGRR